MQKFKFQRFYNQSDAVGAMDGMFMAIKKPNVQGEQYYSGHEKAYGMMLLAICDFDNRFLYVNIGNSGRPGDSLIFSTSLLKRDIDSGNTIFSTENRILVDSAFADLPYFIKSTSRLESGAARVKIEHTFGLFKQQFRLFLNR